MGKWVLMLHLLVLRRIRLGQSCESEIINQRVGRGKREILRRLWVLKLIGRGYTLIIKFEEYEMNTINLSIFYIYYVISILY